MAAHPDQFVRGSPERSSHGYNTRLSGQSNSSNSPEELELIRQRAWRAAEFYHQSMSGISNSTRAKMDNDVSFHSEPNGDPYRGTSHGQNGSGVRGNNGHGTSEAYYPQNLRAGFIDLRNSYNEKRKTKFTVYPSRETARSNTYGYNAHGERERKDRSQERKLYRSNSSLELEALECIDQDRSHLRRDYGSTSSLDVISSGGPAGGPGSPNTNKDSFFQMLQDYRNENPDQRAPPPPQMHEVMRGKPASKRGGAYPATQLYNTPVAHPAHTHSDHAALTHKLSNGSNPIDEDPISGDGSSSPRPKPKSLKNKDRKQRAKTIVAENSIGLFRKKRTHKSESDPSIKSPENSSDGDIRNDERQKRKLLAHYDSQSIGVSLSEIIRRRNAESAENGRRNMTTGASAASVRNSIVDTQMVDADDADPGDHNSNDLVLSCPYFRNELGGEEERFVSLNIVTAQQQVQQLLGNRSLDTRTLMRPPACNGVSVVDMSMGPHGYTAIPLLTHNGLVFEYVDQGAHYYRHFFNGMDHQNFFGQDEFLGPIAISLKREKLDEKDRETWTGRQEKGGHCYQYRIITRTSELQTLRCAVLEEALPSSSRLSSSRGLPPKEVLEFLLPELNLPCLKLAVPGAKTSDQLIKLDEQGIYKNYKFGVLLSKCGQSTEEDFYNNHHGSPAFQEFLNLIGDDVRLKGFDKYKGGLDTKTDSTGTHSLYKEYFGYEIMFHVSTMLPFTPTNKQQLLRKRHIGNDIVTIIFQEPGSKPFTPKSVRSQFQHVFIIVRVHSPNTPNVKYSISISRAKDVPPFGPPIPDSVYFNKCSEFTEFLLTKAINAENAVHRSDKFTAMARRTRHEYLKDLAVNYTSSTSLDSGSKLSKFSLGSGRRKDKPKLRTFPDVFSRGAIVWNVQLEDFGRLTQTDCYLGIAEEAIMVVDCMTREVIFTIPCAAVIGWSPQGNSLRLFYHRGECVLFHTYSSESDEVMEVVDRLQTVTDGCETVEKTLQKDSKGQLGFHVYFEGIVSNVEPNSLAWEAGLRAGSRLVEICPDATATLTHDQMLNLLRNASTVRLVYIPPHEDGTARRGILDDIRPNHAALFTPQPRSTPSKTTNSDDHHQMSASYSGTRCAESGQVANVSSRQEHNRPIAYDNSPQAIQESQPITGSHVKQASYDSTGSRSSGGRGSDRQGSRPDLKSLEPSVPVRKDSRNHQHPRDMDALAAAQNWKVYPAYNADYANMQNISPHSNEASFWFDQHPPSADPPDHHGDSGYHSNNSSASRTPKNSYLSQSQNITSASYYNTPKEDSASCGSSLERPYRQKHVDSGAGLLGPPSMTNLSLGSDLSSHSGETHNKTPTSTGQKTRLDDPLKDTNEVISTSGRQRQQAFQRRSYLESSPHGSNSGSPKTSRHLMGMASEENLARLRPGARGASTKSSPPENTFQEDLMRLINPDMSFTGSDKTPDRVRDLRTGRLQRTQSDESICGTVSRSSHHTPLDSRGDVIFTTAKLAKVILSSPDNLTTDQKLSPRATVDMPGTIVRVQHTSPIGRQEKKNKVVLPDAGSGLDWSNLLDAASAFENTDLNHKSVSMGKIHTEGVTANSTRPHHNLRSSKSTELNKSTIRSSSPSSNNNNVPRSQPQGSRPLGTHLSGSQDRGSRSEVTQSNRPPAIPTRSHGSGTWRTSGSANQITGPTDSLQRIQELESRVLDLEEALDREHEARVAREAEVQALREDNLRLQDESQMAAAQLRKFTEWFFNNIDRQ